MHAYSVSIYYTPPGNQSPWAEPFEMSEKIEQGSDFDVDNGRRLFLEMPKKLKR